MHPGKLAADELPEPRQMLPGAGPGRAFARLPFSWARVAPLGGLPFGWGPALFPCISMSLHEASPQWRDRITGTASQCIVLCNVALQSYRIQSHVELCRTIICLHTFRTKPWRPLLFMKWIVPLLFDRGLTLW